MSRILSEEEVDALLRGVREGAVPGGGRATAGGVQTLDLTSQERNLRGRLPGLELVVDRFVRGLRTSLGALLGHPTASAVGQGEQPMCHQTGPAPPRAGRRGGQDFAPRRGRGAGFVTTARRRLPGTI